MVYKWKPMAMVKADAQKAGEVCEELQNTIGLTARNLLEVSRPEEAPLHNEFEWDDSIAAEAYREEQARYIIRQLVIQTEEEQPATVRAFFKIEGKTYEDVGTILMSPTKTQAMLERALTEFRAFRAKYYSLKELTPLFEAYSEVENGR